jgi:hypothetical protein
VFKKRPAHSREVAIKILVSPNFVVEKNKELCRPANLSDFGVPFKFLA